jgi:hypothetical protein
MPGAASVEAEDEFIKIGLEMPAAQAVIDAQCPDLEVGEDPAHPRQHDMGGHLADDVRVVADAGIGRSAGPAFRPSLRLRQLRSIEGEMPSSLAICSNGRPRLANSTTASRLNSSLNRRRPRPFDTFPLPSELNKGVHQFGEPQAALAQLLEAINSSQGDLTSVFEAVLDKATSLCDAVFWHFMDL